KIGVSVRHIFKPISYLEIQLLSGVSGGYIKFTGVDDVVLISGDINNVIFHFQPEVSYCAIFTGDSSDPFQFQFGP
ncbi:hypothetical protein, partial [Citrobacter youngae]|uniref:hypothetical protein n=1 Tax=Citrobacter youngae TaxID=133448 RepID=UPI00397E8F35